MGVPSRWLLAVVASSAITSSGCFTYLVGSKSYDHDATVKTGAILTTSEVAAGAAFGAIMYAVGNPKDRLPLGGSIAVGIGLALLLDVVAGGIVGLTGCIGNEACE